MKNIVLVSLTTCLFFVWVLSSSATEVGKRLPIKSGFLAYSAFQCSVFSEQFNDVEEQKRLFSIGYKAGQKFLKKVHAGEVNPSTDAPTAVILLLAGPTDEFILGRIYEFAADYAFDIVVKDDSYGLPLPVKEWRGDEARVNKARTEYQKRNCQLLNFSE